MAWTEVLSLIGADGRSVLSGSGAPGGGLGSDGDFYINTATSDIYGPKTAGAWGSATSLIGATGSSGGAGSAGADGKTVRNGSGAPGGGLGVDGDFYIDTTADAIYGPKTGGAWGSATPLVGATGSTGSAGADGADGNGLVWSDRVETLADGATVTPDAQDGLIQCGLWTCATATPTLNPPDNGVPGAPYRVQVLASGAQRVITLSSGFVPSTDDVIGTVTVPSGKWCSLMFECLTTVGWMYVGKKTLQ